MNDDVKALLKKRDYITTIQKVGDGCIITYPHPRLLDHGKGRPRLIENFSIRRGNNPGFWVQTSLDEEGGKWRFVAVPEYAMRIYIMCEAAACNSQIPVEQDLMVFVDEDASEREDIEDVLSEPSSTEDLGREGFLYRLVIEARNDGFPPEYEEVAETHGVAEGYNLIRKFYP